MRDLRWEAEFSGGQELPGDGGNLGGGFHGIQVVLQSFPGGFNLQSAFLTADEFAGLGFHVADVLIVMAGIVMEEEEFLHPGGHGEGDRVIDTGMAPADVAWVFRGIILGVHDEDFRAPDEIDKLLILLPGELQGLGMFFRT